MTGQFGLPGGATGMHVGADVFLLQFAAAQQAVAGLCPNGAFKMDDIGFQVAAIATYLNCDQVWQLFPNGLHPWPGGGFDGRVAADHGLGPTHPHLIEEYKAEFGRDPKDDFPDWESGHKTLMIGGGIPGIENVGGDLHAVTGKRCTFMATPWRWRGGDGCGIRILAAIDPEQKFRFETGL